MKISKNGITRTIDNKEWGLYCDKGWHKCGCSEPQPSQEWLYIVDAYTIAKKEKL